MFEAGLLTDRLCLDEEGSDTLNREDAPRKKRKAPARAIFISDEESDADLASQPNKPEIRQHTSQTSATASDVEANASSAETDTETPPSSGQPSAQSALDKQIGSDLENDDLQFADSGSDKENAPKVLPVPARRNGRAAFIIESDSE